MVDAKVTAFSIIGMYNWTGRWFSPAGARQFDEIPEQIANMALRSAQQGAGRRLRAPDATSIPQLRATTSTCWNVTCRRDRRIGREQRTEVT